MNTQQAVVKGSPQVQSENKPLRDARAQNPLPPAIERVVEQSPVTQVVFQDVSQVPWCLEILLEIPDHIIRPGRVERVFDVQSYQQDVLADRLSSLPLPLVRYGIHDTTDGVYRGMPFTPCCSSERPPSSSMHFLSLAQACSPSPF